MKTLRLVLGDQLDPKHSWFDHVDPDITYLLVESRSETDYARHHVQKVVGFFAAMRRFANTLRADGHAVEYVALTDPDNTGTLIEDVVRVAEVLDAARVEVQESDEYRMDEAFDDLADRLDVEFVRVPSEHFLTERMDVAEQFGDKQPLMETFYRSMRRRYDVLMDGSDPVSGRWNYDAENRRKLPRTVEIPEPLTFGHDVGDIADMVQSAGVETIGRIDPEAFVWPLDRSEALQLLEHFIDRCLPLFGAYQDALTDRGWSLFHSRLSFALNLKMLRPLEVVRSVEDAWQDDPDRVSLAQAEGFIRQILGWREFMRGIYWANMPRYASLNHFGHDGELPAFYWTGETDMACMAHAIGQSLEHAYAHHIQRLMVTGNFALLAGVHPDAVDAWYLGIYIDAIEWVEMPNTRGMSQYADGGIVGTKPYISGANYLSKMGDHCRGCRYDPKQRIGDDACPFNSLYWRFIGIHRDRLAGNHRMAMMVRLWDRFSDEERAAILDEGDRQIARLCG